MDILAHGLWAAVGAAALARRLPIARRAAAMTIGMAALPDIPQMLPVLAWWAIGGGNLAAVRAFAIAVPGQEPLFPPAVLFVSHHLHCLAHSAIVAGLVTMLVWKLRRTLWIPLLGWWSHIVIDVFTHSADYYASPVLYPFTQRGFDGIAWNTPWFMAVNYVAFAGFGFWLFVTRTPGPIQQAAAPSERARALGAPEEVDIAGIQSGEFETDACSSTSIPRA